MARWLLALLIGILVLLQYRLWIGNNSLAERNRLEQAIEQQRQENARLEARNQLIQRQVEALREGNEEIEARARQELGLIREGETFYLILDAEQDQSVPVRQQEENP